MKKLKSLGHLNEKRARALLNAAVLGALMVPSALFAQPAGQGFSDTEAEMCGFLSNVTTLLNLGSIAIVTIAIIFAGYQIAFAHKRISDVAPILIGGVLIGAAAQIANMLIGDQQACGLDGSGAGGSTTMLIGHFLPYA